MNAAVVKMVDRIMTHATPESRIAYEYGCEIGANDPDTVNPKARFSSIAVFMSINHGLTAILQIDQSAFAGVGLRIAIAHRSNCDRPNLIEVRVIGLVRTDDIDWTEAITLTASDVYITGGEQEIRLKPDALVEIALVDWRPIACD